MKKVFLLLFANYCCAKYFPSIALSDLIETFYVQKDIKFDVIVIGAISFKSSKIINEIENYNHGRYSTDIINFKENVLHQKKRLKIDQSAIIFVKTIKNARLIFSHFILNNNFFRKLRFIFCIEDIKNERDLMKIMKDSENYRTLFFNEEGILLHFSYFLVESRREVRLISVEWFTQYHCNELQLITLDSFIKASHTWINGLKIQEKFKRYHGCLIIFLLEMTELAFINPVDGREMGLLIDFYNAAAKIGNFSTYFQFIRITLEGRSSMMSRHNRTLSPLVYSYISSPILGQNHYLTSFDEISYIFLLTPGEKYTNWEKVLLPFDFETWICLLIIFGSGLITVSIINRMSKATRSLVYGEGVHFSTYNIIGTFFGIGQFKLPRENFARILLMFFILFCLVIRTAYQGVLFEMMSSDMRKKLPRTINDLHAENFTIYYQKSFRSAVDSSVLFLTEMIDDDKR